MADPGGRIERDPDDWFAEVDAPRPDPPTAVAAPAQDPFADDWLAGAGPQRRPGRGSRGRASVRWVAIGAALVGLLLGGLAAVGVFSASHHPAAAPPTQPSVVQSTTGAPTTTQPASRPLPAPTATLQSGDTGTQVATLQRALAGLGYATGAVDGVYGPKTAAAVTAFQHASSLAADAIVGPLTRAALVRALARSTSG